MESLRSIQPRESLRSIQAVFLDAGGVFFLPETEVIAPELAAVGIDADDDLLAQAHYAGMRSWDVAATPDWSAYTRGYATMVAPERLESAAEAVGRAFRRVEWSRIISSSVQALDKIASADVQVAVVSNSDGAVEGYFRDRGIAQVGPGEGVEVNTIIDSHVVGVAKPDPRIFEIALERVGIGPEQAIHVGDSLYADVGGAEAAGVRPVHLDPYGFCDSDGHTHVRSLIEVLELL